MVVDLRMAQFEKLSAVSDGSIAECVQPLVDLVPVLEDLRTPYPGRTGWKMDGVLRRS